MGGDIFFQMSEKEALKSTMIKKIGSVLVYNNKIISKGHNTHVKKPRIIDKNESIYSIHSEINCIKKSPIIHHQGMYKKAKLTIYLTRISNDGKIICVKPCQKCQNILDKFLIKYECNHCN